MSEPRTAKATAARRRQSEERSASHLRERGWTCVPPEGEQRHLLRAVLRADEGTEVQIIIGPGEAARSVDVLHAPGPMPKVTADPRVLRGRFAPFAECLREHGYEPGVDGWTVGVDHRGPYAAIWCRHVGGGPADVARVTFDASRLPGEQPLPGV